MASPPPPTEPGRHPLGRSCAGTLVLLPVLIPARLLRRWWSR